VACARTGGESEDARVADKKCHAIFKD